MHIHAYTHTYMLHARIHKHTIPRYLDIAILAQVVGLVGVVLARLWPSGCRGNLPGRPCSRLGAAGMTAACGTNAALLTRMAQKRKPLHAILKESERDHNTGGGVLSLFDLLCIGIGSTIGSGVFVLTGKAIVVAGPAAVIAWLLAGILCLLSSSSYMELVARLPTKGSCYVFSGHGLGEVASVVAAACLTMEYGIAGAGVARAFSAKVYSAMGAWWVLCYDGSSAPVADCDGDSDFYADPVAGGITALCVAVLVCGLDFGKLVINAMTVAKVLLIGFMIAGGFACRSENMFASPEAFAPKGVAGVVAATSQLFFGFVGFDEVCCMASKAERPCRTMPRALAGTLLGAALLSGMAQLALAAMVHETTASSSFEQAFASKGLGWAAWTVRTGELVLLPLVVLLSILPQPEVMAAMAEDGLLPSVFGKKNPSNGARVRRKQTPPANG